ncbi:MAG TPA: hypothetical protein VG165_15330 [Solirubrobacteraceae bacterium]|jgi:hypothetical protein|nr:hypothetical protein [Solirubrobacteraceae bacterium]
MTLFPREAREADSVPDGAGPALWLLTVAAGEGAPLTQTRALARAVVREAAERWPDWWDTEAVGPPHQEAELAPLELLHDGLRRLRLARRRGSILLATVRGKALAADEPALLRVLAADSGGGDLFGQTIAGMVLETLALEGECVHDRLNAAAWRLVSRGGWRGRHGQMPARADIDAVVSEVLWRGTGYGLIDRAFPSGRRSAESCRFALTGAGRTAIAPVDPDVAQRDVCVFDAKLVGAGGVTVRFAVAAHQHLTVVHDVLNEAFGWDDDHLYAFSGWMAASVVVRASGSCGRGCPTPAIRPPTFPCPSSTSMSGPSSPISSTSATSGGWSCASAREPEPITARIRASSRAVGRPPGSIRRRSERMPDFRAGSDLSSGCRTHEVVGSEDGRSPANLTHA